MEWSESLFVRGRGVGVETYCDVSEEEEDDDDDDDDDESEIESY